MTNPRPSQSYTLNTRLDSASHVSTALHAAFEDILKTIPDTPVLTALTDHLSSLARPLTLLLGSSAFGTPPWNLVVSGVATLEHLGNEALSLSITKASPPESTTLIDKIASLLDIPLADFISDIEAKFAAKSEESAKSKESPPSPSPAPTPPVSSVTTPTPTDPSSNTTPSQSLAWTTPSLIPPPAKESLPLPQPITPPLDTTGLPPTPDPGYPSAVEVDTTPPQMTAADDTPAVAWSGGDGTPTPDPA